MRKFFYAGAIGWILFEAMNVYFIMPFPGSQKSDSIDLAFFLYQSRWNLRIVFLFAMALGFLPALRSHRWITLALLAAGAVMAFVVNRQMAADHMFYQPGSKRMASSAENIMGLEKLVLGVVNQGEARAYPIQLIAYHHQVLDTVAGKPLMVTYCSVCRTGRVYEPMVNGKPEAFRLVGMDHFNAMFEDASTGSWWRQATGQAIAGPLKGKVLPEVPAHQTTLRQWLALYPDSKIFQPDTAFKKEYQGLARYDSGLGRSTLTRTDTGSWNDKSWVVGVTLNGKSKAYDWHQLKKAGVINDAVGGTPLVLIMGRDNMSFFVFRRPDESAVFSFIGDSLRAGEQAWDLKGTPRGPGPNLEPLNAYQEFWHSWRSFHPGTDRYQ
jgi:hypothetical protein